MFRRILIHHLKSGALQRNNAGEHLQHRVGHLDHCQRNSWCSWLEQCLGLPPFEDRICLVFALYAARLCASLYSSTVINVLSVYHGFVPAALLNGFSPGPAMAYASPRPSLPQPVQQVAAHSLSSDALKSAEAGGDQSTRAAIAECVGFSSGSTGNDLLVISLDKLYVQAARLHMRHPVLLRKAPVGRQWQKETTSFDHALFLGMIHPWCRSNLWGIKSFSRAVEKSVCTYALLLWFGLRNGSPGEKHDPSKA
jgi:hypothetical protein